MRRRRFLLLSLPRYVGETKILSACATGPGEAIKTEARGDNVYVGLNDAAAFGLES